MAVQEELNRKIHLDFHTPHWVEKVGQDYDPELLVRTWKEAHINAVTVVFGLCACGNAYYASEIAAVHPGLQHDMLTPLLPVASRENIKIYVHFSPGINDRSVIEHPEWAMKTKDGLVLDTKDGNWGWPCYNSPFITERLWPQLEQFVEQYPSVEGIYIDMVMYPEETCCCSYCQAKAIQLGLDLDCRDDVDRLHRITLDHFIEKTREIVKSVNPQMSFSCNCLNYVGGVRHGGLDYLELEAPVTWNSYYYPIMSRHVRTLDKPACGMTTRFPINWGYFGSINNETQLTFECAAIMATLGSCCIGDQLHPSGKPDAGVYDLIKSVYAFVQEREPWVLHATTVPYIGIVADQQRNLGAREVIQGYYAPHQKPSAFYGAGLALLEGNRHFDVLDEHNDFSAYKLLWLPENVTLHPTYADKLEKYVLNGGRLLITGGALWENPSWRAILERLSGVHFDGMGELKGEFIQPHPNYSSDMPTLPFFVKGMFPYWTIHSDAEIAAKAFRPYEEIDSKRRFGHFHAPAGDEADYPGAVIHSYGKGKVAAVAASLAADYFVIGSRHIRQLILNLIDALLDAEQRLVEVDARTPSIEISLMSRPNEWVLHLVQYAAKRNTGHTVIEEIPTRFGIPVTIRPPAKPVKVMLAPSREELDWTWEAGTVKLTVPELSIYQMVVLELEDGT